jgi:hypothetical protein
LFCIRICRIKYNVYNFTLELNKNDEFFAIKMYRITYHVGDVSV